ncbi:MAG TPA: DUF6580 family putative transport protein [Verrucomicrobiales bacterium]|jgi:hypothetical protein|nr:DUF6580 family putative transport protein [Verrucomicrobiales bacterium]
MLPAIILLASIVLFRIAPWLSGNDMVRDLAGYSPLMAFALCGGVFLPRKWALWLPVSAVAITHVVINVIDGQPILHPYFVLTAVAVVVVTAAGIAVSKKASLAVVLGASLLSTVLFHLVSNTVSFFIDPGYAKTLAGWWQCQTTGLPGYLPTWVFTLRQLGVALGFTALFYAAFRQALPRTGIAPASGHPAPAAA